MPRCWGARGSAWACWVRAEVGRRHETCCFPRGRYPASSLKKKVMYALVSIPAPGPVLRDRLVLGTAGGKAKLGAPSEKVWVQPGPAQPSWSRVSLREGSVPVPLWASLSSGGGEFWYSPAARKGLQGECSRGCGLNVGLGGELLPSFLISPTCHLPGSLTVGFPGSGWGPACCWRQRLFSTSPHRGARS